MIIVAKNAPPDALFSNLGYQKRTSCWCVETIWKYEGIICTIYILHNVNRYIGMCLVISNLCTYVCRAYMMYIYI